MRAWAYVLLLTACNGGTDSGSGNVVQCGAGTVLHDNTCVALGGGVQCGSGTHEESGMCLPDARYEIRAASTIRADGYSASEVLVVGTNPDGSPSLEPVIVSVNRANAGAVVSPALALGDRGAATNFMPCNSVTPGCLGQAQLNAALASAPQVIVASVQTELVAPPTIGSIAPCMNAGNIFYIDSQNFGTTGTLTITTDGTFDVFGAPDRARVQVYANNVGRSLEMNTSKLGTPLLVSVYDNTKPIGYAVAGEATFELSQYTCDPVSAFQIHELTYNPTIQDVTLITATFEQYCASDPTRRRTGCVHYSD